MQKVTFVLLQLLSNLWKDDARWQANVEANVAWGYTLAMGGADGVAEDGEMVLEDFASDELEFVAEGEVQVYDFAGSIEEEERFYGRDEQVYKDKATGRFWLMYREDIDSF